MVLPDWATRIPVRGSIGTTESRGCLLLYSGVGETLIFPVLACYPECRVALIETGHGLLSGTMTQASYRLYIYMYTLDRIQYDIKQTL